MDAHHALARRAAAECVVLLKNEGSLLPLAEPALASLALIGRFAVEPRYQGAGSSQVVPARPVETLRQAMLALAGSGGSVSYAAGYGAEGALDEGLLAEAQETARRAHTAVVVVGLPASYEQEGSDRAHLDLPPGHDALVEAVLAVQPRTVIVLVGGSAMSLPWADHVPTLLAGWLGGQAGAGGVADVLVGRVNPSGRLAETFPLRLVDTPAYLSFTADGTGSVPFSEGLFTGYRWYEARHLATRFPFGHGLSYTTFAWEQARVEPVGNDGGLVRLSLEVRNTGSRAGSEVVQVYVREVRPRLRRPLKELKAFAKVSLAPGEKQTVSLVLQRRAFTLYDPEAAAWVITSPDFEVLLGASSADIRATLPVSLPASEVAPAVLTRFSPLRLWLEHPAASARLSPVVGDLLRRFFGGKPEASAATEGVDESSAAFLADLPIAKLVMFGALSEDELARLVALTVEPARG
jgi:beta-glucosidase